VAVPDLATLWLARITEEVLRYAYVLGAGAVVTVALGTSAAVVVALASRWPRRRRPKELVLPPSTHAAPGF
jgi:hypothetical protein